MEYNFKVGSRDSINDSLYNTGSRFTCKLASPLKFNKPYEVGMTSITYNTLRQRRTFFGSKPQSIQATRGTDFKIDVKFKRVTDKPKEFLTYFNQIMIRKHVMFSFKVVDEQPLKVQAVNKMTFQVEIDTKLSEALGFLIDKFPSGESTAEKAVDNDKFLKINMSDNLYLLCTHPYFSVTVPVKEPSAYSFEKLVNALNVALLQQGIAITYRTSKNVKISSAQQVKLSFSSELAKLIGRDTINLAAHSEENLNLNLSLFHVSPLLLVKSNVVQAYQFGSSIAPVLKVILPSDQLNKTELTSFTPPEYFPVSNNSFDEIDIEICDELENPVDFEGFPVDVCLKFRPQRL